MRQFRTEQYLRRPAAPVKYTCVKQAFYLTTICPSPVKCNGSPRVSYFSDHQHVM